ncbi:MAG: hypothetical protein RR740_00415 [Pseudomonas sp.]
MTLLLAGFAVVAVAGDKDDRYERYQQAREYPHIHGDWRKPYIPPRTYDSRSRYDDSYQLDDDYHDRRRDADYLSDDESDDE